MSLPTCKSLIRGYILCLSTEQKKQLQPYISLRAIEAVENGYNTVL